MASTSNTYTVGGSGQAGPYPYGFPIIDAADVKVSVDGQIKTVTTHYTVDTANTRVTFVSGQEPSTGEKVIVYRDTDEDPINATFVSGSTIRSDELNDNFRQLLYIAQESDNQSMSTLGGTMQANFTLGKGANLIFEGTTEDANETTVTVADPTADRTITLPNVTGTVVTTGDTGTVTATMLAVNSVDTSELVDGAVTDAKIAANTITAGSIAANAVTASELADNAVDTNAIADDAVTSAKIANDTIVSGNLANNAVTLTKIADASVSTAKLAENAVTGLNIADDAVNSEHYVDGSIDNAHISNNAVTGDKIASDTITSGKLANNAVTLTKIADASVSTAKLAENAVTAYNMADDSVNSEHYIDGSIDEAHISNNAITADKIAANAVGTSEIADAELVTLAGMPGATASILASATALTSTTAELNLLDGKSIVTSVGGSSTDVQLPTAKAVNDQILALTQAQGGFYPIADELKFPNANPDPGNDAGTIVSIADAGGLVVNGSGVSTTGRTLGGATVTINGIDSSLHNTTIAAGKGMLVQTTSTLNTYDYHRLVVDEAGVASAQTLVNDFNDRYQVASSAPSQHPDGSALADGDLWFDTSANVMKVYDLGNTSYAAVTSVGDYKLLTVVPDGATSGSPVYTNTSFDLRDGSSAASVTSVGQLLVSVNGVLQKPNAGTYSSSNEGFHLEGTNGIKFCTAPGTGASVFVTLIGSATSVNTPATNSIVEAAIQANVVSEEKLKISNAGSNGQFLSKQSGNSGGLTWASVTSTPEGTAILSTGESGASKYLREDGDGTCSWQEVVGAVADNCIYENSQTISNNYTIASGKGAHSVGPITVNATVTVNGNWVVS